MMPSNSTGKTSTHQETHHRGPMQRIKDKVENFIAPHSREKEELPGVATVIKGEHMETTVATAAGPTTTTVVGPEQGGYKSAHLPNGEVATASTTQPILDKSKAAQVISEKGVPTLDNLSLNEHENRALELERLAAEEHAKAALLEKEKANKLAQVAKEHVDQSAALGVAAARHADVANKLQHDVKAASLEADEREKRAQELFNLAKEEERRAKDLQEKALKTEKTLEIHAKQAEGLKQTGQEHLSKAEQFKNAAKDQLNAASHIAERVGLLKEGFSAPHVAIPSSQPIHKEQVFESERPGVLQKEAVVGVQSKDYGSSGFKKVYDSGMQSGETQHHTSSHLPQQSSHTGSTTHHTGALNQPTGTTTHTGSSQPLTSKDSERTHVAQGASQNFVA